MARIRETIARRIEVQSTRELDDETIRRYVAGGMLTAQEVERDFKISPTQLYKHMDNGRLPYVRDGRARKIPREALIDFLALRLVRRGDLVIVPEPDAQRRRAS